MQETELINTFQNEMGKTMTSKLELEQLVPGAVYGGHNDHLVSSGISKSAFHMHHVLWLAVAFAAGMLFSFAILLEAGLTQGVAPAMRDPNDAYSAESAGANIIPTTFNTTTDTVSKEEEFVTDGQLFQAASDSNMYQDMDAAAKSANIIPTTSDTTIDTVSKEEEFVANGQLVQAPSDSKTYQDMDAMCTLKRYAHLFGQFCDPFDRSNCDLEGFKAYFQNHSANENLIGGCPLKEAVCYAKHYPDLFSVYCDDNDTKCDYYSLRDHYEKHGMKERHAWGCDFQPIQQAAIVSHRQPAVTIDKLPVSNKYENVLGKASLQVFQGSWEPVEFSEENFPSQSKCPSITCENDRFCNFTTREGYQPAKYVASGLPEWSARRFKESMIKDGGHIVFIGDSVMRQLFNELRCSLEEAGEQFPDFVQHHLARLPTLPESIQQQFEWRRVNLEDNVKSSFSLDWVDQVIAQDVKYLVYNTGAWWNPKDFKVRGEWCNYDQWEAATQEELLSLYTETMEHTLLPIFTSLVENHGVIPIWMDIAPGGKMNLTTGEHYDMKEYGKYYRIFPRLNEIGRKMMVQAGGLVLPIWDASFPRSMDHMFSDKRKAVEDQLHWCSQRQQSVPFVWVQLLEQVLYGNNEQNDSMNSTSNKSKNKSSLRSLQSTKEETSLAQDISFDKISFNNNILLDDDWILFEDPFHISNSKDWRRRSLDENPGPFVPLSWSNESPCECADAMTKNQCRANIRCSWSEESNACLEHS